MANRISLISLGCPKNIVDSNNLIRKFIKNNFLHVNNSSDADILLINTCGFIEDAKKESIEEILKLAQQKNRSKKLIVFGCLAKRYKDELLKEIPDIDAIFGVGEDEKIVEYCKKIKGSEGQRVHPSQGYGERIRGSKDISHLAPYPFSLASSYAYLKIAEGCSKKCTYCVIPSIRGDYRSIPHNEIMKESRRLIKAGVKELILVAQDTACYGRDTGQTDKYDIASLLKDIASIKGDFWIRLLYAYPSSVTDSLLDVIANEDKICKYLDIPFQHSEDRILRLMKRKGTQKEYLELIKKIRNKIPEIALRTTFIVGFPSETEKEFSSLLDFIEKIRFDRLGAFKFSKEEGTPASKIKGQISDEIKKKRVEEIMRHQAQISLEKNKELTGRKFEAIIDEISNRVAIGRLYSHTPDIDGVVIMEEGSKGSSFAGLRRTDQRVKELKAGSFVTVKITEAFEYDLKGVVVE